MSQNPIYLDRDVPFFRNGPQLALPSAESGLGGNPQVRTNGVVSPQLAEVGAWSYYNATSNAKGKFVGCLLLGPDVRHDHLYTSYYVHCVAGCNISHLLPICGFGVAPAAPTAVATGQTVEHNELIAVGHSGSNFGTLNYGGLVHVRNFNSINATDLSARAVCFWFGFVTTVHQSNPANALVVGNLNVQRLVDAPPDYIDRKVL